MPLARITRTPEGHRVMAQRTDDPIRELVPGVPDVAQVIRPAERQDATVEAEGGETVVGDVNRDGFIEHMRINGPAHAQGGVPLELDPGSFIFSDSKRLRIKDPEVLARFTKGASKKGITPAAVAKQYDLNSHVQVLKNEDGDAFSKQTAQLMLDTQGKKLAELALEQEKMKGLPTGVPLITQQLLPDLAAQYMETQQEAPQQVPTFANGGEAPGLRNRNTPWSASGQETPTPLNTNVPLPKAGSRIYLNQTPIKVESVDVTALSSNPNAAYITLSNGARLTRKQWQQVHSEKPLVMQHEVSWPRNVEGGFVPVVGGDKRHSVVSSNSVPQAYSVRPQQLRRTFGKDLNLGKGDSLTVNDTAYEVLDPHGEYSPDYSASWKSWRDTFDDTKGIIKVKNKKTGETEYLEGEDVLQARKNAPEYFGHVDAQLAARQRQAAQLAKKQAAVQQQNLDLYGPPDAEQEPSELEQLMAMPDVSPAASPPAKRKAPPQVVHVRPRPVAARPVVAAPVPASGPASSPATPTAGKASTFFDSL